MPIFTQNINPIILDLGPLEVRWYGVFFAIGLVLAYFFGRHLWKREKLNLEHLDSIIFYLFLGMLIGARLGHILFYNLDYYLQNPLEILMIWHGGLASHGAAIGVFIAYLIWIHVHNARFAKYADLLVLGMPLVAGCVRIGNFFNSEIIGIPTNGTWGVIFQRLGEDFPRHPSQLYEAALSFAIFAILYAIYRKWPTSKRPPLFLLFLYIGLYFITRFRVEFYKEHHVLTDSAVLSMGQWLSLLPIAIAGTYFIALLLKKR